MERRLLFRSALTQTYSRRLTLTLIAEAGYVLVFALFYPVLGPVLVALSALPVALGGWLLGRRLGLACGVLTIGLNLLLMRLLGGFSYLGAISQNMPNSLVLLAVGGLSGWARTLVERLSDQSAALTLEHQALHRQIAQRRRTQEELQSREAILQAVSFAAERFLERSRWEESIGDVLQRLGMDTHVSRVYIFQNSTAADGTLLSSIRYEWVAPGVRPQLGLPDLQRLPLLATGYGRWVELLSQGQAVFGHVRDFPADERALMRDLCSIVIVPIFVDHEWWGIIGFDQCVSERAWSKAEIDALRAAAGIIGAAIQRQQAEEAVRESEARYRLLASNASDLISRLSPKGRFLYVSPASQLLLGYAPDQLLGRSIFELCYPEDLPELRQVHAALVGSSLSATVAHRVRHQQGHYIWLETTSRAVRSEEDGAVLELHAASRDISARKQAERERELLIVQLQEALANIKTLGGLLPICMSCKKIRDDRGYWNQIETYIRKHSEASFTHALCPECAPRQYPHADDMLDAELLLGSGEPAPLVASELNQRADLIGSALWSWMRMRQADPRALAAYLGCQPERLERLANVPRPLRGKYHDVDIELIAVSLGVEPQALQRLLSEVEQAEGG